MVFLAVLILLCFFALIYGLYIKIGKKESILEDKNITFNLYLEDGHKITDIDIINNEKILFTITNNNKIYALIYNIKNKKVTRIEQENDKR